MVASCCSLVSLYTLFLRRAFYSAGLKPRLIPIDDMNTLHCWVPVVSDRSKPPVVLINGFGPSAVYQWRRQVKYLTRFFNLYIPDLVFFGGSTTKSAERSEIFQAECVVGLTERLGVGRYSVVGTSYGGMVAYHMARIHGERVVKVVAASSALNKRQRDTKELMEKARAESIEDLMLPDTAARMRTLMGLTFYKPPAGIPNFMLNGLVNEALIIWGEYDQLFPLEMAYELKSFLGEKTRLEVMRKTSHVPQIEHPRLFIDIV